MSGTRESTFFFFSFIKKTMRGGNDFDPKGQKGDTDGTGGVRSQNS